MNKKPKGFLRGEQSFDAGTHLLLDFQNAKNLDNIKYIEKALRQAVKEAGATLLNIGLHKFSPQGVSGVAIVSESHISIHTWPEHSFAALDIFMCGQEADPYKAVASLKKSFEPEQVKIKKLKRGY